MLTSSFRTVFAAALMIVALPFAAASAQPMTAASAHSTTPLTPIVLASAPGAVPSAAFLAQTDDVIATLFTNPEHAASLTSRPERAASDFARFALATTATTGAYVAHDVLGAEPAELGRTYTYAQVEFAKESVLLRLTWKGAQLVTVTRGVAPGADAAFASN